jgi:hypothetical protein
MWYVQSCRDVPHESYNHFSSQHDDFARLTDPCTMQLSFALLCLKSCTLEEVERTHALHIHVTQLSVFINKGKRLALWTQTGQANKHIAKFVISAQKDIFFHVSHCTHSVSTFDHAGR